MKTFLIGTVIVVAVLVVATVVFREPLLSAVFDRLTADMFVASDDDAFDPGVAIGEQLPPILARIDGREVTSVDEFMGTRGMVFVTNRSVDW